MLQAVAGNPDFVRLLDFGLAKFTAEGTQTSMAIGTPAYMAPEQVTRRGIGPWTDLYAVGVMAFELLTGRRPFPGRTQQEVMVRKIDPSYDPTGQLADLELPEPAVSFLRCALAPAPEDRYRDTGALRSALRAVFEVATETRFLATAHRELDGLLESSELARLRREHERLAEENRRLRQAQASSTSRLDDREDLSPSHTQKASDPVTAVEPEQTGKPHTNANQIGLVGEAHPPPRRPVRLGVRRAAVRAAALLLPVALVLALGLMLRRPDAPPSWSAAEIADPQMVDVFAAHARAAEVAAAERELSAARERVERLEDPPMALLERLERAKWGKVSAELLARIEGGEDVTLAEADAILNPPRYSADAVFPREVVFHGFRDVSHAGTAADGWLVHRLLPSRREKGTVQLCEGGRAPASRFLVDTPAAEVSFRDDATCDLEQLARLGSLRRLDVRIDPEDPLASVGGLVHGRHLVELRIDDVTRWLRDLDVLPELGELRKLTLDDVAQAADLSSLGALDALQHLSLAFGGAFSRDAEGTADLGFLADIPTLEVLSLSFVGREDAAFRIPELPLPSVRHLRIGGIPNGEAGGETLAALAGKLPEVEVLHLDAQGAPSVDLAFVSSMSSLEALEIVLGRPRNGGPTGKPVDLRPLAALEGLRHLRLRVHPSRRWPGGALANLSALGQLRSLEDLELSGCACLAQLPGEDKLSFLRDGLSSLRSLRLQLDCLSPGSDEFSALATLENLRYLDLRLGSGGRADGVPVFADLSPLGELTALRTLVLHGVGDAPQLDSLSKLRGLEYLDLELLQSKVTDLGPLGELETLDTLKLKLSRCRVSDLDFARELDGLRHLVLDVSSQKNGESPVLDISGLGGLVELRTLHVGLDDATTAEGFASLGELTLLEELVVADPTHLGFLRRLKHLRTLSIEAEGDCSIRDLSPLAELPWLEDLKLYIPRCLARDLAPLGRLHALRGLTLELGPAIESLAFEPGLPLLDGLRLYLQDSELAHLGTLAPLPAVQGVSLMVSGSNPTDISALGRLSRLASMTAELESSSGITAIHGWEGLERLKWLDLRLGPNLTDLSGLARLPAIRELSLGAKHAGLPDLDPIEGLDHLERLSLYGSQTPDLAERKKALRAALPQTYIP